jgi:hypothetical protein
LDPMKTSKINLPGSMIDSIIILKWLILLINHGGKIKWRSE